MDYGRLERNLQCIILNQRPTLPCQVKIESLKRTAILCHKDAKSFRFQACVVEKVALGLLVHVTSSNGFRRILRSEALVYKSYFFRTAVIRKLFDISFSYIHCNFSRVCLLVKMVTKTVTRSITNRLTRVAGHKIVLGWKLS